MRTPTIILAFMLALTTVPLSSAFAQDGQSKEAAQEKKDDKTKQATKGDDKADKNKKADPKKADKKQADAKKTDKKDGEGESELSKEEIEQLKALGYME